MTLYRFLGLTTNEQAQCILQASYMAIRVEYPYQILLYRIDDFYAEVFYNIRENKISHVKGFRANSHLVPYNTYKT